MGFCSPILICALRMLSFRQTRTRKQHELPSTDVTNADQNVNLEPYSNSYLNTCCFPRTRERKEKMLPIRAIKSYAAHKQRPD